MTQGEFPDAVIDHCLLGATSPHVVIGPLVWREKGQGSRYWYFSISTADERGFRADQIITGNNLEESKEALAQLLATLAERALVVHVTDDELQAIKLCEILWPGERVTKLRQTIEAERNQPNNSVH